MVSDAHEKSRAVWDERAGGWERNRDFMWATTRHVGEWLVDRLGAGEGDTILDLAGGPGDNGFLASPLVGPSGKVIVTDFAPQMVETARRLARRLALQNVEARVMDAEKMDLQDDSIDGIICRWGFMLMLDPASALRECRRVLKDGRRLAFSVWADMEKNPWVTVTGMTLMQLGHQPPGGDPFGPGGMFSLADHDSLRALLTDAGFGDVAMEEMPVVWSYGSFDEAWSFMSQTAGAIASTIKDLAPEAVFQVRAALETNLRSFKTAEGMSLPGVTVNVVAS